MGIGDPVLAGGDLALIPSLGNCRVSRVPPPLQRMEGRKPETRHEKQAICRQFCNSCTLDFRSPVSSFRFPVFHFTYRHSLGHALAGAGEERFAFIAVEPLHSSNRACTDAPGRWTPEWPRMG